MSEPGELAVSFYHRKEGQRYGNELEVIWYYKVLEGEVEAPDHECGPDCPCWRKDSK